MLVPADRHGPLTLVLPTSPDPGTALSLWTSPRPPAHHRLAALLGPTRAAVLEAVAEGRGTGQIARHLGISPAGASQHATVLREAGLIATTRHRNAVRHTLTPLGALLLNGGRETYPSDVAVRSRRGPNDDAQHLQDTGLTERPGVGSGDQGVHRGGW
ncbi:hypothetical protein GCM10022224_049850 [Nonomuraea antimicrobica]|uniref:HTH arsR-type domain-containing protein n=2 Tax=Nonomuraea antimicrobica TaxID=561173 RepID=A0ABP7C4K5_9ACTN